MNRVLLLPFLISLVWGCSEAPTPGTQVFQDAGYSNRIVDGYWVYLPRGYEPAKPYPVILFLQGGLGASLDPTSTKNDGPAKYAQLPLKDSELATLVKDSFIIVNPHITAGKRAERQWYKYPATLKEIVEEVILKHKADPDRVYLTGLSRGGHGSFELVKILPETFAAVIPISGILHRKEKCEVFQGIPTWIIHNVGDRDVYVKDTDLMVKHLISLGIEFQRYQDVRLSDSLWSDHMYSRVEAEGHDAWNYAYASKELYQWLLTKKRQ